MSELSLEYRPDSSLRGPVGNAQSVQSYQFEEMIQTEKNVLLTEEVDVSSAMKTLWYSKSVFSPGSEISIQILVARHLKSMREIFQ